MRLHAWIYTLHEHAWILHEHKWTLHEHALKLIKISGFAVDFKAMWPVSEIGTLIFVAGFEGPIILLKICEIHLQVSSIHTM